jgi:thiaminase/transcriptional activator TenA
MVEGQDVMSEIFSDSLRKEATPIWESIFRHPFLVEMGDGSLPLDKFAFYVKQDYAYLVEFARCLGIATAKTEDMDSMRTLASRLDASLTLEVDMLERLAERLEIPLDELRRSELAPTNMAYTRHMLHVAYSGHVGEIIAALLPCVWTYQEIAERLGDREQLKRHRLYDEWCSTYRTQSYAELAKWYRGFTDRLASESDSLTRGRMRRHFMLSSKYEYMFWDMAYRKEAWPI